MGVVKKVWIKILCKTLVGELVELLYSPSLPVNKNVSIIYLVEIRFFKGSKIF
jgi:hypothetical protein